MKTKIFPYVFIAVIYLFPFRYAFIEQQSTNTVNLLCFLATAFGTLIFYALTFTDGKGYLNTVLKEQKAIAKIPQNENSIAA